MGEDEEAAGAVEEEGAGPSDAIISITLGRTI